ncbi:alpha/beta fold hydrolase [uncultured Enterovirga sp.]|uniref:alpha/beta fold hydrolase n=1 Tax=uncultured Enterovirga sp. TaxID=2026352 RepID=UPI0035C997A7
MPKLDLSRAQTGRVTAERLFYAQFGQGEDVLLLHGGLGSSDVWAGQVRHLAGRYRVTVMDTRGHGRSPVVSNRYGFALFAGDVEKVLDHLDTGRTAIVGWSDGGITGLLLAMSRPERVSRLFAYGANASPGGLIAGGSKKPAFAAYAARCREEYLTLSPEPKRWPDLVAGLGAMWRREPNVSTAQLATIRVPTTIAFADRDEIIRPDHARYLADTIPGARSVALKDVSHLAMLQDPARFNAALDAFLAG